MVVQGDACHLPFRDVMFDFCISSQVIEHIPDDKTMIGEISRVLRGEGILYISTAYPTKSEHMTSGYRLGPYDLGHVRDGYTFSQICRLLRNFGFKISGGEESGFPQILQFCKFCKLRGLYLIGFFLLLLEKLPSPKPTGTFAVAIKHKAAHEVVPHISFPRESC